MRRDTFWETEKFLLSKQLRVEWSYKWARKAILYKNKTARGNKIAGVMDRRKRKWERIKQRNGKHFRE